MYIQVLSKLKQQASFEQAPLRYAAAHWRKYFIKQELSSLFIDTPHALRVFIQQMC